MGRLFLETEPFYKGIRPAISVTWCSSSAGCNWCQDVCFQYVGVAMDLMLACTPPPGWVCSCLMVSALHALIEPKCLPLYGPNICPLYTLDSALIHESAYAHIVEMIDTVFHQ